MNDTVLICPDCGSDYEDREEFLLDYSNGCPLCGEVLFIPYEMTIIREVSPSRAEEFEQYHANLPHPLEWTDDEFVADEDEMGNHQITQVRRFDWTGFPKED